MFILPRYTDVGRRGMGIPASGLEIDGSLRDIYVFDTSIAIWNRFLDLLYDSSYQCQCFSNGDVVTHFRSFQQIKEVQLSHKTLLTISLSEGATINCHFFVEDEIEMDMDPRDFQSESNVLILEKFLTWLSCSLDRQVTLTHENSPDHQIYKVNSADA